MEMKNLFAALLVMCYCVAGAQDRNVGIGTLTPDINAVLELQSSENCVVVCHTDGSSANTTTGINLAVGRHCRNSGKPVVNKQNRRCH